MGSFFFQTVALQHLDDEARAIGVREGKDVTLVSYGATLRIVMEAADCSPALPTLLRPHRCFPRV